MNLEFSTSMFHSSSVISTIANLRINQPSLCHFATECRREIMREINNESKDVATFPLFVDTNIAAVSQLA